MYRVLIASVIVSALAVGSAAAEVVRVGVLKFGTVNWLMETIRINRLDEAEGYTLEVVPLAGKAATTIAFQSAAVDLIVSDWVWAMRQNGQGASYRFFPYSRALGSAVTRSDSGIGTLCDFTGRPVGVVGGPLDKSWLVLQALAAQTCDVDLSAETQTLYGAPPLMSQQLSAEGVDAVVTYWHYAARLMASGETEVIAVSDAIETLGIDPVPALVGFVWDRDRSDLDAITKFRRSVDAASARLAEVDTAWDQIRPLMKAADQAEFIALRDRYRDGIATRWTEADTQAAARTHALLTDAGGPAFVEAAGAYDPSVFLGPDD